MKNLIEKIQNILIANAGPITFTVLIWIGLFLCAILFGAIESLTNEPLQYR